MSALTDGVERLRALIWRRREERELAEELRVHAEMEAEWQRRGGTSEDEARRRGLMALGGVERVKEDVRDVRGTRLLEDATADVAYSFRALSRSPGFTAVAILTLAIGIGGTTAVFSAVDAVLLQPLPYQQPGQLVRLYQNDSANPGERGFVTPVHFLAYRSGLASLEAMAAISTYSELGADIGAGDAARRIRVMPASADYFDVVRVQPDMGNGFRRENEVASGSCKGSICLEGTPLVVLSHQLWESELHGDASAVGRSLVMNGLAYRIAGVMPRGFRDPVAGAVDAWVPLNLDPGKDASNVDNHYLSVIARLRPGTTIERAQAELQTLGAALVRQYPQGGQ
ncbi:MAG TPA: ABC transporter permease, partial [Steroidobacteraceae bacterium]|nr:ABC transporter permease [Steroidobacteraceae bacterium]